MKKNKFVLKDKRRKNAFDELEKQVDSLKWLKEKATTFSDAVIAIIITIMVLGIPLPTSESDYISYFGSIFIYLVSFFIVANFWYSYHRMTVKIQRFSKKILIINFLFLASLSLIPLSSKWVMVDTMNISVINYGVVYLIVQLLQMGLLYVSFRQDEEQGFSLEKMRELFLGRVYLQLALNIFLILLALVIPKTVMVFYLALPILAFLTPLRKPLARRN